MLATTTTNTTATIMEPQEAPGALRLHPPRRKSSDDRQVQVPQRKSSSRLSRDDEPDLSDDDMTAVTSNTNPSNNPTNCCGGSHAESERWSSGDAVQPAKRGSLDKSPPLLRKLQVDEDQSKPGCIELFPPLSPEEEDSNSKPGSIEYNNCPVAEDNDEEEANSSSLTEHSPSAHSKGSRSSKSTRTRSSKHSTGSSSSSRTTPPFQFTEEIIRAHMKDYYEDFDSIFRHGKSSKAIWESFFSQYYTEDILWVRSSSNTLMGKELAHHFANDIEGIRMQIVSIENIQLLGSNTAVVVFTADQEFLYRGTPVSDRTVLTMVLHAVHVDKEECEEPARILIAHEHRCIGKPIPKDTRWK